MKLSKKAGILSLVAVGLMLLVAPLDAGRSVSSQAAPETSWKTLGARLEETARALDGIAGYAVLDLTTGERLAHRGDEPFPPASVIKLAILLELFHQAAAGEVALESPHPFDRRFAVGGTGVLARLAVPALSPRDYAVLMIELSDNSATNVLIDLVGMDAVNARLDALGLRRTRLGRRMMDFEAIRQGRDNVATPRDLVDLLAAMHRGTGLPPATHADMLSILKQPPVVSYLRRGLPADVDVASKYGTLSDVRADAAIVYVPDQPYAMAVMTKDLKDAEAGERAIAEMSQLAYEHFRRLGA